MPDGLSDTAGCLERLQQQEKDMNTPLSENIFAGLSGRVQIPDDASLTDLPLVIAIHGGTYTSSYFDLPGYSLIERAKALGVPLVALDRPGHGNSAPLCGEDASILGQARFLTQALHEAWEKFGSSTRGIVLIGHSIGAAIATCIAADPAGVPVIGLAISGVGLRTPSELREAFAASPDALTMDFPLPMKEHVMFGPPGSFLSNMPHGSHAANGPALRREIVDINTTWPENARGILGRVRAPVHYRQAQVDRLWIVDEQEVQQFAAALIASPSVDAQMVKNTGHCMDFHRIGAALQVQQLGFALQCAAEGC